MGKRAARYAIGLLFISFLVLSFQNCTGNSFKSQSLDLNISSVAASTSVASGPSEYQKTKFGILYNLWHCDGVYGNRVWDTSKALVGEDYWAPIPNFSWWTEPQVGYYCYQSTPNWKDIIKQHAEVLRDAGIDFIILDFSNTSSSQQYDSSSAVTGPLAEFLPVWNSVPGAPKIAQFIQLTTAGDMFPIVQNMLDQYPQLQFFYQGKPLALIVNTGPLSYDSDKYQQHSEKYTLRGMWAVTSRHNVPLDTWGFFQNCQDGFLNAQGNIPCNQTSSIFNGQIEQVSVAAAYQMSWATHLADDVPKFQGRTFVQQFATAFEHPEAPIVTINTWNEWMGQRFCLINGASAHEGCNNSNDHWPNGMKIFVDTYNAERNRDIEPSKTAPYDYYYRLMKNCIGKFRQGQMCAASDIAYVEPPTVQYSPNPPIGNLDNANCTSIGGWTQDPDALAQSLNVAIYIDDVQVAKIPANNSRADLCTAIGSCNHGYDYPTPALLKDGRPHQVRVFGADNANGSFAELDGSPKMVTCNQ